MAKKITVESCLAEADDRRHLTSISAPRVHVFRRGTAKQIWEVARVFAKAGWAVENPRYLEDSKRFGLPKYQVWVKTPPYGYRWVYGPGSEHPPILVESSKMIEED